MTAENNAPCIECGDHRGWRVQPDWNTGEAVQVQCRACTEHVCDCPIPPEGTVEHDERCCMNGVPATAGPHPNCPGVRALQTRPIPPGSTDGAA